MDIIKIAAVGIITAFCVIVLRETKSEVAMLMGIVGGCIILLMLLDTIGGIFDALAELMNRTGIDASIFKLVFKIMGIGYITEFSADIIEESGSKALAGKVLLAGKVIIFALSLPIMRAMFELIAGLLQ